MEVRMKKAIINKELTEEVKISKLEGTINLIGIILCLKVPLQRLVKMIKLIKNDLRILYVLDIKKDTERS